MKKIVLVVEDDIYILDSIKLLLELEDYDVVCANNGQEGIDRLNSMSVLPNIILLDLMMPVKDGFEFRNEQINNPKFAAIPVVVLTAEGNRSARKDQLKADALINKPFEINYLLDTVRDYSL
jgi:CheY-like chemotaxis protein